MGKFPKILSRALLECHQEAADSGNRFALQVFEAGRNRLENEGAMALAEVFEVECVLHTCNNILVSI